MSTTRIEKAARLISQGKVRPIQARSFVIEGDSGTYFVSVAAEQPGGNVRDASCTCVFSRTAPIVKEDCSHVEAARAMLLMEERESRAPEQVQQPKRKRGTVEAIEWCDQVDEWIARQSPATRIDNGPEYRVYGMLTEAVKSLAREVMENARGEV